MAQETKSTAPADGTLRDILSVMERKTRNLEKRRGRLELYEKELDMGNQITTNQLQALDKKEEVLIRLEALRELRVIAEQMAKNDDRIEEVKAKKAEKAMNNKILDTVAQVLRLQSLLDEGSRREEIEDNEVLGILRTASLDARKKNYRNAARFWLQVVEAKPKEFATGVTFQAAHEKLTAIGTLLEKLDEVNLIDGEDGGRGESPFTSSVGESETASDHQPNRTPSQPATNEHNVSKQQDEISISPTEDVTLNNELDAEQAAPALPRQQQPHVVQNNHHHIPPQQETSVVTSPAVAPAEHPHLPVEQQIIIPGISMVLPPVQPGEDAIQFGSLERVVHHAVIPAALIPAAPLPPAAGLRNPVAMFEGREFDFIQDDLTVHSPVVQTAAVHMDPAVVYATGVGHYDHAHFQQLLQYQHTQQQAQQQQQQQQQAQQQQSSSQHQVQPHAMNNGSAELSKPENGEASSNEQDRSTKAAVDSATSQPPIHVKESSRNGYSGRDDKERRSPQENLRHNRGSDHEGGKGFYRGMNGNKGGYGGDNNNGGRWNGHRSGHWNNRENRDRREGGYNGSGGERYGNGHSHSRHNNTYGGGNHNNGNGRNNTARREPTAQRV